MVGSKAVGLLLRHVSAQKQPSVTPREFFPGAGVLIVYSRSPSFVQTVLETYNQQPALGLKEGRQVAITALNLKVSAVFCGSLLLELPLELTSFQQNPAFQE